MTYKTTLIVSLALALLAACVPSAPRQVPLGPDGRPLPVLYRINPADTADIQFRMLDNVNALRAAAGVPAIGLDATLTAAAATHARDMALQNRAWHFGSDGSSPIDRARRASYAGLVLGETISETYESELETLSAWMAQDDTRAVIVDPGASDLGVAFYQEETGKLWWVMILGAI